MEKGIRKDWTTGREKVYENLLATCHTFAEQQLIMVIRDLMKYDQRTKAGKRANAQAKLCLVTCSDDELKELAELESELMGGTILEQLAHLKQARSDIQEEGIKRSELE